MTSITAERNGLAAVGMRHRRRYEWNAARSYTDARTVTEPATRVFIHITVTNPENYSSDDAHARAVESIGISRFPNTGISYNRGVMHSGNLVYEFQPIGRRGAHTVNDFQISPCSRFGTQCPGYGRSLTAPSWNLNYNSRAYVICQNVDHTVTDDMVNQLALAIAADALAGFVTTGAARNPHGHRCVSAKSCPGDRMWARMHDVANLVDHYIDNGLDAGLLTYDNVWRTDNIMAAPPLWDTDPHWWPETMLEHIGVAISELRDGLFDKPHDSATQWRLWQFFQWAYGHSATAQTIREGNSAKLDTFISKLDEYAAGQASAATKIDQIAGVLDQHATGVLDEDAVVDGVRDLVHQGTATTS